MNLAESARDRSSTAASRGFAMAALLIAMAVMAVLMTVAMPTWKQMMQRDREAELVFRGEQYARAIGAYQRKNANASPPTIDVLIEQRLLRKKYKDPMAITDDGEFAMLYVNTQGQSGQGGSGGGTSGTTGSSGTSGTTGASGASGATASTTPNGPIIGVASKNTAASIRVYKDHTHYNEWQFVPLQQTTQAGGGQGGGQNGGRGRGQGGGSGQGQGQGQGQGRQSGRGQGQSGGQNGLPPLQGPGDVFRGRGPGIGTQPQGR